MGLPKLSEEFVSLCIIYFFGLSLEFSFQVGCVICEQVLYDTKHVSYISSVIWTYMYIIMLYKK